MDGRERASLGDSSFSQVVLFCKSCAQAPSGGSAHVVRPAARSLQRHLVFQASLVVFVGLSRVSLTIDAGLALIAQTVLFPPFQLALSLISPDYSSIFIVAVTHHVTALNFSMTQILSDSVTVSNAIPVT